MSKAERTRTVLKAVSRFVTFFVLVAFVITCCMMLFLSVLSRSLNVEMTAENLGLAAKLTFANVVLLSLVLTVIDIVRREIAVERPARRIIAAAEDIMQGDFSVRIPAQNRLMADDTFRQLTASFNTLAEELGSVETLRTDFIANVSHEMKTPLAVMQNYGTLLQSPDLPEDKRLEYAKGITENARRMAAMMTNILKLNRLENQQIFPQSRVYDLSEQLCACLLDFENVWESSAIDIETAIEDGVKIRADAELLALVWNNLFSNAFKFTPAGGTVAVSLHTTPTHAVVTVRDTGCGMTPEVGAHIFEKFYQGDTSRATQGNGLGLALVRRVVDILHAQITVQSTVGVGTTFTVTMRRAYDE